MATSLGDGQLVRESESGKAFLVRLDSGAEIWIPKSVLHDNSECYQLDDEGDVVVETWWAERENLA